MHKISHLLRRLVVCSVMILVLPLITGVALAGPGSSRDEALLHQPPGPDEGDFPGSGVWYQVYLHADRPFMFRATGASKVNLYGISGTSLTSCLTSSCSYTPTTSGDYYILVNGTSGKPYSLTSEDGLSAEGGYSSTTIVVGDQEVWFKAGTLKAGTTYTLIGLGPTNSTPTSISLARSGGEIVAANQSGHSLDFTPSADDVYYAEIVTGPSPGRYSVKVVEKGSTWDSAYPYAPDGTITSKGVLYLSVDLEAYRKVTYRVTGGTSLNFLTNSGAVATSCIGSSCSYTPTVSGTYYLQVAGTRGAAVSLTAEDGFSLTTAYKAASSLPAYGVGWYRVSPDITETDISYVFQGRGPSGSSPTEIHVTNAEGMVVTESSIGPNAEYVPPVGGTYYAWIRSGTERGNYSVRVVDKGSTFDSALPYSPSGAITASGAVYYEVTLDADREYRYKVSGGTSVNFVSGSGSSLTGCTSSSCAYTPKTSGVYYLRVNGTARNRITLTVQDGLGKESAYTSKANLPSNGIGWYQLTPNPLRAGTSYVFTANGPTGSVPGELHVVRPDGRLLASTMEDSLEYTPVETGTHYAWILAGTANGSYSVQVAERGSTWQTALPYVESGLITSTGTVYYEVALDANREYRYSVSGRTSIDFVSNSGSTLTSCASTSSSCAYTPKTSGVHYLRFTGTPGNPITLTVQDGLGKESAYTSGANLPSSGVGWYRLSPVPLNAGTSYVFAAKGPTGSVPAELHVVRPDGQLLASTMEGSLEYAPLETGTHYAWIRAGAANGGYSVQVVERGSTWQTALPYVESGVITGTGTVYYEVALDANREYRYSVSGGTTIDFVSNSGSNLTSCTSSSCTYTPKTSGVHYLRVTGTARKPITFAVQNGLDRELAYTSSANLPSNGVGWYRLSPVPLNAGTSYVFTAKGPTGSVPAELHVVRPGGQLLASIMEGRLEYTPLETGTHYAWIRAGAANGSYSVQVVERGSTWQTALPYVESGVITGTGTVYYEVSLDAYREYRYSVSGGTIEFVSNSGSILTTCTSSSCTYTPKTGGVHYLRVTGTARKVITLTVQNGLDRESAYTSSANLPSSGVGWYRLSPMPLDARSSYVFTAKGPTGSVPAELHVVRPDGQLLASTMEGSLAYTPIETGTHHAWIRAGTANGSYSVQVVERGSIWQTALPYVESGYITSKGLVYYEVTLEADRQYNYGVSGGTTLNVVSGSGVMVTDCAKPSCTFTPTVAGTYYLKVTGKAWEPITLSVQDGLSMLTAYTSGARLPAGGGGWYRLTGDPLKGLVTYSFTGQGPSTASPPVELSLYDEQGQIVASSTPVVASTVLTSDVYDPEVSVVYTPPRDGFYYVWLKAGTSSGKYSITTCSFGLTVTIDEPANGAFLTGPTTLKATANDSRATVYFTVPSPPGDPKEFYVYPNGSTWDPGTAYGGSVVRIVAIASLNDLTAESTITVTTPRNSGGEGDPFFDAIPKSPPDMSAWTDEFNSAILERWTYQELPGQPHITGNYYSPYSGAQVGCAPETAPDIDCYEALKFTPQKLDRLWSVALSRKQDPRFLLAVLRHEGTGSFNSKPPEKDQQCGGHCAQVDFEADVAAVAQSLFPQKLRAYTAAHTFRDAWPSSDLFTYLGWWTPIDRNGGESGVYATHFEWHQGIRGAYDELSGGLSQELTQYTLRQADQGNPEFMPRTFPSSVTWNSNATEGSAGTPDPKFTYHHDEAGTIKMDPPPHTMWWLVRGAVQGQGPSGSSGYPRVASVGSSGEPGYVRYANHLFSLDLPSDWEMTSTLSHDQFIFFSPSNEGPTARVFTLQRASEEVVDEVAVTRRWQFIDKDATMVSEGSRTWYTAEGVDSSGDWSITKATITGLGYVKILHITIPKDQVDLWVPEALRIARSFTVTEGLWK